jgi:hypothetical protein
MMLWLASKTMRLVITAAALLSGPAAAETPTSEPPMEAIMSRIHVIVGNDMLSATLDETPAGPIPKPSAKSASRPGSLRGGST